jgi:hypothetical protein
MIMRIYPLLQVGCITNVIFLKAIGEEYINEVLHKKAHIVKIQASAPPSGLEPETL